MEKLTIFWNVGSHIDFLRLRKCPCNFFIFYKVNYVRILNVPITKVTRLVLVMWPACLFPGTWTAILDFFHIWPISPGLDLDDFWVCCSGHLPEMHREEEYCCKLWWVDDVIKVGVMKSSSISYCMSSESSVNATCRTPYESLALQAWIIEKNKRLTFLWKLGNTVWT